VHDVFRFYIHPTLLSLAEGLSISGTMDVEKDTDYVTIHRILTNKNMKKEYNTAMKQCCIDRKE
jgi:hypothetical protein